MQPLALRGDTAMVARRVADVPIQAQRVNVEVGPMLWLPGELVTVPHAAGLVLFAHGSGSSRHSSRNRHVAESLQRHRLATLLFDLLTDDEVQDPDKRFDIALLARRVVQALDWAVRLPALAGLRCGLFGASTGAAAALVGAATRPAHVDALVSRGGRPDLAGDALGRVLAPTLLLVGGGDPQIVALNRAAMGALRCEKRLEVIPNAGHLFEEPGALDSVAEMAAQWFEHHLSRRRP